MKKLSVLLFVLTFFNTLYGQLFQRLEAPVYRNGSALSNAWAGGLNAPQWSSVDLNNDGKMDLYAFDRNGNMHLAFLHTGGVGEVKYQFSPLHTAYFPACGDFVLMRDFNRDGAADIFVSSQDEGVPGLKVYRGKFENNLLVFKRMQFPWLFNVITVPASGAPTNLPISSPDYPAIDDLDNDGDLDILSLNSVGSQVAYFKNVSLEKGFTTDTLIFEYTDQCWGKFGILPFSQSMTFSDNPNECAVFFAPDESSRYHGGATLCTFDEDNDGDKEVLYGDLIYPNIIKAKNGGNPNKAWLTEQDTIFPSYNTSIEIIDFPATFHLDVDNDGIRDLVASPNIAASSPDYEVAWFYKNTGSNEFPHFELQRKDLIVDGMLDFGTGAQPAFFDYDGDGLMDIVVGNLNRWMPNYQNDPFLVVLKNVGTSTEPAFEVVDENWLNFKQFAANTYTFAPTFGDLDGDGDLDLLVGERFGNLFYAENTAGSGNPPVFGSIQPNWQGINVGQYSTPFIYDLNRDGLPDLIVGERNGNINYMPNLGTPGNPVFHPNPDQAPNNRFLGKINTQSQGYVTGYSAPVILYFGDTLTYLITGSEAGYLEAYIVNLDSLDGGSFELVSKKFGDLREGAITRVAFANLNDDGFMDAVVGNYRGGLGLFSSPLSIEGVVPAKEILPKLSAGLFPNPVRNSLSVQLEEAFGDAGNYRIFNVLGQLLAKGNFQGKSFEIRVQDLKTGIYFLEINIGSVGGVWRFVKE